MGWRRRYYAGLHSSPPIITPFEKQVMAKDNAMLRYGFTMEELDKIPHTYRRCHGNGYAVWSNGALMAAKEAKAVAAEAALVKKYGREGLAKMRADEAAKKKMAADAVIASKARAARVSLLADRLVALAQSPRADKRPTGAEFLENERVPRPQAKKVFGVTDTDLRRYDDLGPAGRSKSSFAPRDVLEAAFCRFSDGRGGVRDGAPDVVKWAVARDRRDALDRDLEEDAAVAEDARREARARIAKICDDAEVDVVKAEVALVEKRKAFERAKIVSEEFLRDAPERSKKRPRIEEEKEEKEKGEKVRAKEEEKNGFTLKIGVC